MEEFIKEMLEELLERILFSYYVSIEPILTVISPRSPTTIREEILRRFPVEKCTCFVCNEVFYDLLVFKEHTKGHGIPFSIKSDQKVDDVINLRFSLDKEITPQGTEEKFVCTIEEKGETEIDKLILVVPPQNSFRVLTRKYYVENVKKFDIYFGHLSTADHPYSILILFSNNGISMLTQYLFTVEQSFYDQKIKDVFKRTSTERYFDPFATNEENFELLSEFYPSTKKEFLLSNIKSGVTKENYKSFWRNVLEIEDFTEFEQFERHTKYCEQLQYIENRYYMLSFPFASKKLPKILRGTTVLIFPSQSEEYLNELSLTWAFSQVQQMKGIKAKVEEVKQDHIIVELVYDLQQRRGYNIGLNEDASYDLFFIPHRFPMQVMQKALSYVEEQNITEFFFPNELINSNTMEMSIVSSSLNWEWINESVKTNPEQQTAIMHIVEKTSVPYPYILMGPPGTGKTTTIVEAVCQIIKREPHQVHILIAANSNDAVNVIAHRLLVHLPKDLVHRVFSASVERNTIDPELVSISNLRFGSHYYPHVMELSQYNVILTTLSVAGKFAQAKISSTFFSYVFIDEAGSSTEPATIVPIAGVITSHGTIHGQIILAGDPKQLGPVVLCTKAEESLGKSLLERLTDSGIYARGLNGMYNPRVMTMLLQNYRSHPKILEFSNEAFYNANLKALGKPKLTHWACNWKMLPNKSIPILFENVIGQMQQGKKSTSLYNMREVDRVIFHIQTLLDAKNIGGFKITEESIGVITPYKMQCDKIEDACKEKNWKIDVGSVEKFQGQEKPIMILSTVRSQTHSVGFLNNPKRLNVALTRAQALLIIVGNVKTLEKDTTWKRFIAFCRDNDVITTEVELIQKSAKNNINNQKKNWRKGKVNANDRKFPVKAMKALNIGSASGSAVPKKSTDKMKSKMSAPYVDRFNTESAVASASNSRYKPFKNQKKTTENK